MRGARSQSGQAAVELVAVLPLIAVLIALLWQAVLAGQAIWLTSAAARAAARASALGGDPRAAARRILPARLRRGLAVAALRSGGIGVSVVVPALWGGSLFTARSRAAFPAQR